jgi:hypothetical protein
MLRAGHRLMPGALPRRNIEKQPVFKGFSWCE